MPTFIINNRDIYKTPIKDGVVRNALY